MNCIYLTERIPFFLTHSFVNAAGADRQLKIIVDVSCDTTNPNNPIPVYGALSSFTRPVIKALIEYVSSNPDLLANLTPLNVCLFLSLCSEGNPALHVIAIDHLPTLLPREASEQFSADLLPSLLELPKRTSARVWTDAEELFHKKVLESRKWLSENEVF